MGGIMWVTQGSRMRFGRIAVLLAALLLVACASPEQRRAADLEALRARAQAFWAARMAGDVIKAYEYEKVKATGAASLSAYARKGGLVYKKAEVRRVEPKSDTVAIVKVYIEYLLPGMGQHLIKGEIDDRWEKLQGQWYHAPCSLLDRKRCTP